MRGLPHELHWRANFLETIWLTSGEPGTRVPKGMKRRASYITGEVLNAIVSPGVARRRTLTTQSADSTSNEYNNTIAKELSHTTASEQRKHSRGQETCSSQGRGQPRNRRRRQLRTDCCTCPAASPVAVLIRASLCSCHMVTRSGVGIGKLGGGQPPFDRAANTRWRSGQSGGG